MTENRKTMTIGLGQKGEPPQDAKVTSARKPEEEEVGGRSLGIFAVACPSCYAINYITGDTMGVTWHKCWNCMRPFSYLT